MPRNDFPAERLEDPHLRFGEVRVPELVAGVLHLDADGGRIDVSLAGPDGEARMPGALVLRHQLREEARFIKDIVRGYLALGPREPIDGLGGAGHACVMEQEHARDTRAPPGLEVGRGVQCANERAVRLANQSPRSLAIVS